ncbi:MAG: DUF721 domain-containing protein [Bryobacteraceae bacterium]
MERAGRLLAKIKLPETSVTAEERVRAAWPAAVGPKIASKTRIFGLVRSTLVIEVEDIVWQRQLTTLCGPILKNLCRSLGPGAVTEIDLRPAIARRGPQSETEVRRRAEEAKAQEDALRMGPQRALTARPDAEGIADPVLGIVYRNSRKKATG